MFDTLLDLLFPRRCVGCSVYVKNTVPLCAPCIQAIELHRTLFCGTCRARIPEMRKICHLDTPYLLGAATDYGNHAVRGLIHDLKFSSMESLALPLARILIAYARELPIDIPTYTIIPLPLSGERERERGFNQTKLIAEHFGAHFNAQLNTHVLFRTAHHPPQSHMRSKEARRENVAGSFTIAHDTTLPQKVILIDDVTTSGATFFEASRALKTGGVREIIALAVARA